MTQDAHGSQGARNGHRGPLLPASPNIGLGGSTIVVLAIITAIMQGSLVVHSAPEMHMWAAPAALSQGTALWSATDPEKLELPPYNSKQ